MNSVPPMRSAKPQTQSGARYRLTLGALGPIVIAALLPSPGTQLVLLSDGRADVAIGAAATVLAIATTWSLMVWSALIAVAAIASRLPGAAGQLGGKLLALTAPVAMRRILAAAAGVSIAAGLGACGTPAAAGSGAPGGTGPSITAAAMATSTLSTNAPGSADTEQFELHLDLDWPANDSARPRAAAPLDAATADPAPASSPDPVQDPGQDSGQNAGQDPGQDPMIAPGTDESAPESTGQVAILGHADPPAVAHARPPASVAATGPNATGPSATGHESGTTVQGQANPATSNGLVTVTVQSGDCLWAIAARQLPAGATEAQIDAEWRAWYAANSAVIGPNPNLVTPGLVLHQPGTSGSDMQSVAPESSGGMQ